jgi:hydroxymethylglutaryl-CoA reductase (NADPH)
MLFLGKYLKKERKELYNMATNSKLSDEKLVEEVLKNKIKFYELDKFTDVPDKIRLKVIEKRLGVSLENIEKSIISSVDCKANIENMIGSTQIPLGLAGPVMINGENAKGSFYLPLATTEGALVASVNRGCSVINKSGGAYSIILKNEQTRSILFKADSIIEAKKFSDWVENNFPELKNAGEMDEKFIEIKKIERYIIGLNIWLRIRANTNDAMGMNMVTIAGKKIADYVFDNYKNIEFISETGNLCTDKKASAMNLINTRGKKVIASVDIPESVIKDILKTSSEKLIDLNYRKNLLGSAASSSLGFNAHFANIIAAMFAALGQDLAHVVDGSLGFTTVEKNKNGINFSVTLSDLQVGTIGGGTGLKTQKECLSILGVFGPGNPPGSNSRKLAEIISVGVLAGEISLLAALCTKDLSKAHQKHNR